MKTFREWLNENVGTLIILFAVFGIALFLRAYFPIGQALPQHLLSGGSDSFYWERIIRYNVETGKQLYFDQNLAYPIGLVNPRPPLFNWFVAVPGVVLSPLFGDVWQSVTTVLILSTAVWGALTIFPTYFLTKNIFGRRAGLIAAFLLAVMPAHLQRSQATDADHDSMTLFFVVTCFYFFMKALKLLSQRRWVASWNVATKDGRSSIFSGLTTFFRENKRSVLYSVMAGLSMTTVALIWQGWAYVPIILLIYIVLQLFVDRIRNQDPMGMGICFSITMIITFLLSAPWYVLYGQIKTWFDVPLILFLVAAALGFFLTVTRNYPWVLVVPTILLTGGVILAALVVANPAVANAFVSGAGYFVRTKLYETIAEAQPPGISQAILSFGAVTYFFSLLGLLWMIIRLPKRLQPDYMFVLTWSFAAIFMSMAAARFIFNASPAFAVSAGWMIAVVADWIDFDGMRKTFSSLAGGSKFVALRKSVKPRHIIGTLVVVFLLFLPNVWTGVDASIPYEDKAQYERQIFNAVPGFARPPGYTPPTGRTGSTFYLGMFGYSLPLPNSYFPSAWDWFAKQDANVPMEKRPAYLSWWDYGFEAVDRGEHPTVADNFQDGYQLAGQFITAQSEDQAIALLILKLIEGDFYKNGRNFSPGVVAVMQRWGIDPAKVLGAYRNPSSLSSIVLGDPITYGRWDSSMQPLNALYIYLAQYFDSQTTTDQMASFYHDIMEATGWSIRYFGVDSRLFPYDGGGNNIFYAPVKLSDHRVLDIPDGRVLPVDFFSIEAQTDKGTFPVQLVPLGARTSSLNIKYTDMFYKSMFYRAYMGFSPTDVGATCSSQDCLPGIRGDLQSSPPMQAWNLSHFKVVYKTVYYNPWPTNQVQNHTDAWQAMNYFDALDIQREISQGTATGVVDFTNQTMAQSGAVFIKYYDGAYVNGTVTVDGVTPLPGVRVTVSDYEDPANPTPHYTTFTDSEGRYSLLAPFGTVRVVASTGTLNQRTQVGATVLDTAFLIIGDYQAMRRNVDGNGDGIPDYMITQDLVVGGVTLTGHAFLDINNDKNQTVVDEAVANCPISLRQNDLGLFRNMTTNSDGTFIMTHAYPGVYTPTIDFRGRLIKGPQVTVGQTDAETNVPLSVSKLEGTVLLPGNITASGATVLAYDEAWGNSVIRQTDNYGKYSFDILPGNFTVSASYRSNASIPQQVGVFSSSTTEFNITLSPSGFVSGKTSVGGVLQGYVLLTFDEVGSGTTSYSTTSAADGSYFVRLPAGTYDVHARHYKAGSLSAFLGRVVVPDNTSVDFSPSLSEGVLIRGVGYSVDKSKGGIALLNVSFSNGAGTLRTKTSSNGNYMVYLPQGDYVIQVGLYNLTHLKRQAFVVSQDYDIVLEVGTLVRAQVYYDIDGNGFVEPGEGVADAHVTFTDSSGVAGEAFTDASGRYQLTLPSSSVYVMRIAKSGFLTFTAGPGTLRDLATRFTSRVIPANITVTGRLSMQGLPFVGGSVEVDFNAKGSGAVSAIAVSDTLGAYAVSLAPGSYEINVDQPISPGQDDMRFQTAKSSNMILRVGQGSIVRDIPLFMRAKVTGTVGVHGSLKNASMVFQGPEGLDTTAGNGAFSVMLAVGTYTLYANYSEGGTTYAAFQQLTISAPLQLTVDLIKATTVQGDLIKPDGNILPEAAPVTIISDQGATFSRLTDTDGRYTADLIPGNYTFTVRYQSNATIDYVHRYVIYTHTSTLQVTQGLVFTTHDLPLAITLDNSSLQGRYFFNGVPVAASVEFRPTDPNGINATATAGKDGSYYVELAPGPYIMYVHDTVTHGVNIQGIQVEALAHTYLNLSLEQGYKVYGVTTYLNNVRVPSRIVFSDGVSWEVYTDKTGYFAMYMPAARYTLVVAAILSEHGMNVGYNTTVFADVQGDTLVSNLHLLRVPRHGVYLSVKYPSQANATVSAGDSIRYDIVVWNSGSMPDTFQLQGATVGWTTTFDRSLVDVDFGTVDGLAVNTTVVTATIRVPNDAMVEHTPVSITAFAVNETVTRSTLQVKVNVARTRGLTLRQADVKPSFDGKFLNYTLEILNSGNSAESVRLDLPLYNETTALDWNSYFYVNSTVARNRSVTGIIVGANSTSTVTLVLQNAGGVAGVPVSVEANLADTNAYQSVVQLTSALPSLSLEGNIAISGIGIERTAPVSWTLITLVGSFGFVAALFLVTTLRDRIKRRRR